MITTIRSMFILSFVAIVVPFLGFPVAWKTWIFAGVGVLLFLCVYRLRKQYRVIRKTIKELQVSQHEHGTY